MASLAEIAEALKAADAAGNAEDARALAQAYRAMSQATPKPQTQPQTQAPKPVDTDVEEFGLNMLGAAVEPNAALLSGAVATPVSGLAGMLGGILPGPQGQSAEWQRATQNALTWLPQTEGGKTASEAISYPFRKFGEATNWAGEKTADVTGSPAAGAAVKTIGDVGIPAALAYSLRNIGGTIHPEQGAAEWLMRKAVKPSTTLPAKQSARAIRTMLEEGISPTPGGMDKARNLVNALNTQVERDIASSPATVNVGQASTAILDPYNKFRMQVNPTSDVTAIGNTLNEFLQSPNIRGKTDIPVQLAHSLKKGTYRTLEGKYGEVGSASTEAQKALARGLREQVGAAVPSTEPTLAREASLMNVLDVSERRTLAQLNNNPMGLSALAGTKAGLATFLADRSAAFKAMIARMLYQSGNPEAAAFAASSAATGQTREPQE